MKTYKEFINEESTGISSLGSSTEPGVVTKHMMKRNKPKEARPVMGMPCYLCSNKNMPSIYGKKSKGRWDYFLRKSEEGQDILAHIKSQGITDFAIQNVETGEIRGARRGRFG